MAAIPVTTLPGIAAEAALSIPGVAGLHARLCHRLAAVTAGARSGAPPHHTAPEAGVRVERTPDGSGWHIEVRCVVAEDRRALDVAQNVHDLVRTAAISHLTALDAAEPVTVQVTVTRIATKHETASR